MKSKDSVKGSANLAQNSAKAPKNGRGSKMPASKAGKGVQGSKKSITKAEKGVQGSKKSITKTEKGEKKTKEPFAKSLKGSKEAKKTVVRSEKKVTRSDNTSVTSSKSRCPVSKKCGGCQFIDMPYRNQLKVKHERLEELLSKYCTVGDFIGMDDPDHYKIGRAHV